MPDTLHLVLSLGCGPFWRFRFRKEGRFANTLYWHIASHKWIFLRACQDRDFKNNTDKLLKRKGKPPNDYVWLGLGFCDQYSRCFAAILIGGGGRWWQRLFIPASM